MLGAQFGPEAVQHLAVDTTQALGSEEPLEQAGHPAGTVPGALDRDPRALGRRIDRPDGPKRRHLVGLLQPRALLVHVQPVVALAAAGGEVVGVDRPVPLTALLDAVGGPVLGQDPRSVLAVVTQERDHAVRRHAQLSARARSHLAHADAACQARWSRDRYGSRPCSPPTPPPPTPTTRSPASSSGSAPTRSPSPAGRPSRSRPPRSTITIWGHCEAS